MKKKFLALLLSVAMTTALVVPAMADELPIEESVVETVEEEITTEEEALVETDLIDEVVEEHALEEATDEIAEEILAEETVADDEIEIALEETVEVEVQEEAIEIEAEIQEETTLEAGEIIDDIIIEDSLVDEEGNLEDADADSDEPTGLMEMEFFEGEAIDYYDIDADAVYDAMVKAEAAGEDGEAAMMTAIYGSAVYDNEWDRYSNNYVYNVCGSGFKALWEAMDKLCLDALNGKNLSTMSYKQNGVTKSAYTIGAIKTTVAGTGSYTDYNLLRDFLTMYKYSNPQYFFLANGWIVGCGNDGIPYIAWMVYPAMGNTSTRNSCVTKFKNGISKYKAEITGSTKYEKIKSVTDVICRKVVYNTAEDNANYSHELTNNSQYTQSAYSVFTMNKTVCAGYALATELLLNDLGIDCIGLTSATHAFNKVRLDDIWYNLDNTWIDSQGGYRCFLRSDSYFQNTSAHVPESFWVYPYSSNDSGSDDYYAYKPSAPTSTTAKPVIKISGGYVTITCSTSNADIYYTVDGTTPSSTKTRSQLYSGSFAAPSKGVVKAIAVRNGKYDSAVAKASKVVSGWVKVPGSVSAYTYVKSDGTIVKNDWYKVGGKWYHFNASGIMQRGWQKIDKKWYYFQSGGDMATGWQKIGSVWYHFGSSNGIMDTGWKKIDGSWYHFTSNGGMQKGWNKIDGKWYYLHPTNGIMQRGWQKINDKWYYLDATNGIMKTGWLDLGGNRYYLNGNGVMQRGWVKINKKEYYFYYDGHMARNTWIGKYHVNSNGVYDKSR